MHTIGTPLLDPYGICGYIVAIREAEGRIYSIGAGGLSRVSTEYEVAFPERISELPDSIAAPMIERAKAANIEPLADVAECRRAAQNAQAAAHAKREAEARANREAYAAFKVEAAKRMPAWAKAVIVAELIEDQSDSMSDYFGSTTRRTVILGFSKHTRDLFPELRKAAAPFPETASLATAPESAEHREKYSMGGGFYLKNGSRHGNGWQVAKRTLYTGVDSMPRGEWLDATPVPAAASDPSTNGIAVEKHTHTKHGFDMWICILPDRVSREEFDSHLAKAKANGGWYSRAWNGTPAGFAFKSEVAAREFAALETTPDSEAPKAEKPASVVNLSAKLRSIAESMQSSIDDRFRDRLSNTPKRQRQAAEARLEGVHLRRAQQGLNALADRHDAGTVPVELRKLQTKAEAMRLAASRIEHNGGYYDAGVDTGKPALSTPEALAFWELLKPDQKAEAAETLRRKLDSLRFANIPGYFPTPREIVSEMLNRIEARLQPTRILEPEAGSGAIVDVARERFPAADIVTYERHASLCEVLAMKGCKPSGSDFMEAPQRQEFDAVVMNPPFENGQDVEHVQHAYGFLKSGGRLVAIMSASVEFRSDRKYAAFRDWLSSVGGSIERLPDGAFKASGTGVATVIVVADRES